MIAEFIQITTTVNDVGLLETIANELVSQRLAACVQTSGPLTSTFRWQGNIERTSEWQLTAKTTVKQMSAVIASIRAHHSYDLPEIIATPIVGGHKEYLDWIAEQVGDN